VEFSEKLANEGKVVIIAALDGTFQRSVLFLVLIFRLLEIFCNYCQLQKKLPNYQLFAFTVQTTLLSQKEFAKARKLS
jgi:hypothetical protein